MMLFNSVLGYLTVVLAVLVNVAFVTLMERKILGLSQFRLGPNKTGFSGILQPFSDAVKLFSKQTEKAVSGNSFLYLFSPGMGLFITLMLWSLAPLNFSYFYLTLGSLALLMVMGMGVYPLLLAGWSSSSKYAMLGAVRGVAQTISYEISMALILISLMVVTKSMSIMMFLEVSGYIWLFMVLPFMAVAWMISMLAESNRTPFDFSEGESELVSGFNIEYASVGFALLFMAEYGSILFLSGSCIFLFLGVSPLSIFGGPGTVCLAFFWVWARATFPRYRYDLLMNLAWKCLLPEILGMVAFVSAMSLVV